MSRDPVLGVDTVRMPQLRPSVPLPPLNPYQVADLSAQQAAERAAEAKMYANLARRNAEQAERACAQLDRHGRVVLALLVVLVIIQTVRIAVDIAGLATR